MLCSPLDNVFKEADHFRCRTATSLRSPQSRLPLQPATEILVIV